MSEYFSDTGHCINKYLYVRFDATDKKVFKIGDIEIIRPDEWVARDKYGEIKVDERTGLTKYEENTNYLETKPQVCEVLTSNPDYPFRKGDKLFTHYMAWESARAGDFVTQEAFIMADFVFLTFNVDGSYKMADETYLAEPVLTEDEKTPNGIIINVLGQKPKLCQIKLLHVPEKSKYAPGEIVMSIDNYNYPCEIGGKKFIMIREREIVGTLNELKIAC